MSWFLLLIQPLQSTKVEEGKPVTFATRIDGEPMPHVKWFKNGVELVRSPEVVIEQVGPDVSLTIPRAAPKDSGKYTCVAENPTGRTAADVFLTVLVKREF